jgi:L-asparaginase / beta-aspartyl-peptidase
MLAIIVHGGAGHTRADSDGCRAAAQAGWAQLLDSKDSLSAVVEAVVVLENDGRFNAGRGSLLSMDGETIEMDAAVMDTRGALGAVAAIRGVRNPVLVARAVADTPHCVLAGQGASQFARTAGLAAAFEPSTNARKQHRETVEALARDARGDGAEGQRYRNLWNFARPWQEVVDRLAVGTVGAVALDSDGHFAVATSTGGNMPALLGRVGDSPMVGCGFYAGAEGAIAVTGIGEHIIPHLLARTVYGWFQSGMSLQQALQAGMDLMPPDSDIGLIGVSRKEVAIASRPTMPTSLVQDGEQR